MRNVNRVLMFLPCPKPRGENVKGRPMPPQYALPGSGKMSESQTKGKWGWMKGIWKRKSAYALACAAPALLQACAPLVFGASMEAGNAFSSA
jgi:hypothetical protein